MDEVKLSARLCPDGGASAPLMARGFIIMIFAAMLGACSDPPQRADADPVPPNVRNGLIAFPLHDAEGRQQIHTIREDGTGVVQLTFEGNNAQPSWSPDGSQLLFTRRSVGLFVIDADGSNEYRLIDDATADGADWGPDGQIVYSAIPSPEVGRQLFVTHMLGHVRLQITFRDADHADAVHASWGPQGEMVTYTRFEAQDPTGDDTSNGCPALPVANDIWVVDPQGVETHKLTSADTFYNLDESDGIINSAFDANAPDWSQVTDQIVFWSGQENCFGQVWRIDADGSNRVQLTERPLPSHNDDPAWSPDGTKVMFNTDRDREIALWVMNADGSNEHRITAVSPGPLPGDGAWQPIPEP